MARRSTNRVPLIKGPTGADSSPKEKVLARRVAQLEQSTGAVEFSGQDEVSSVVVEGGTSTTVNNVYNITTGGGAGTAIVIDGTGDLTSGISGLPTTIEPQGFYGHAVGASLRSILTSAGHSLQGVYSDDGTSFRPIDSLSTSYPVAPLSLNFGASKFASAASPDFDVPTFDGSSLDGGAQGVIYLASAGVTLALVHAAYNVVELYELFDDGTSTLIATANSFTADTVFLGDDRTSGVGYFAKRNNRQETGPILNPTYTYFYTFDGNSLDLGGYGVAVFSVDFGALYTAWQSSGVTQSMGNFYSHIGYTLGSTLRTNFTNLGNTMPWAGALTGHSTAVCVSLNSTSRMFTIDLSTGGISKSTMYFGSSDGGEVIMVDHPVLVQSPRWGNSVVDVFLNKVDVAGGGNTDSWRIVKYGPWGYVNIYSTGSIDSTTISRPGVVPLSDSATMYFGGAPTHATWYQGGTVYVDLSTL